jgi:ribonuclease HI
MEQAEAFCQPKTKPSFTKSSRVTSVVKSSVCFFDSYCGQRGSGYGLVIANPDGSVHEVYGCLKTTDKNRAILVAFVTLLENFDGDLIVVTQSEHIFRTFTQTGNIWADMSEMVDGNLISHAFDSMENRDVVFGRPNSESHNRSIERAHSLAIKGASRKDTFVEAIL